MQNYQITDDELVDGYLKGDISCFDEIMNRYKNRLYNYIYHHTGHRQLAEDLFQEAFTRVIEHLPRYRKRGNFPGWIFKIALNICRDHMRKKAKMPTVSLNQPFSSEDGEEVTLENLLASDRPSPAAETCKKEIHQFLRQSIAHLPRKQREVVILRIYGKLSFKEISAVLHCPINTALARMRYALKALHRKLKKTGVEDEL
ncbi:MAG: sigma-70 family RNA polymerase sigma factor [Deltaproteobacteria bacterium]|nr:sigma-70 family RNA polymerase sigma factor [Deltaproteobacteria bacterium]